MTTTKIAQAPERAKEPRPTDPGEGLPWIHAAASNSLRQALKRARLSLFSALADCGKISKGFPDFSENDILPSLAKVADELEAIDEIRVGIVEEAESATAEHMPAEHMEPNPAPPPSADCELVAVSERAAKRGHALATIHSLTESAQGHMGSMLVALETTFAETAIERHEIEGELVLSNSWREWLRLTLIDLVAIAKESSEHEAEVSS